MVQSASSKSAIGNEIALLGLSSFIITSFLFFIDEGNYNFHWMTSLVTWIIFVVYAVPIFVSQVFMHQVLLRKKSGLVKLLICMLGGTAIGITLVIQIFFMSV